MPVLASRPGAHAALVRDEQTCLCYDPGERDSIVSAATRLLQDDPLRERLGANAAQLVQSVFSLQAMGRQYDALLRRQLDGRGPPQPSTAVEAG